MAPHSNGDSNGTANGVSSNSNGTHGQPPALKAGIYVPTVAFFDPVTEDVDVATTAKHAIRLARAGIAGIVTQGSNGEAVHLSHAERMLITKTTRDALDSIGSTIPVIAGCGSQSVRETIELCKEAAASGASYTLILPPSYYGGLLKTENVISFYEAVADAAPIPLLIYNYPGACSGLDLSSDTILKLSEHPNIYGVKLTCGNTGKLSRIVSRAAPPFVTFGGSCDFTLQTLVVGGHGVIAGTANIAPKACVKIMELYNAGKIDEARKIQEVVARGDWVSIKGGFIAVKVALEAFEGYGGAPRQPCTLPAKAELAAQKEEFGELIALERSL